MNLFLFDIVGWMTFDRMKWKVLEYAGFISRILSTICTVLKSRLSKWIIIIFSVWFWTSYNKKQMCNPFDINTIVTVNEFYSSPCYSNILIKLCHCPWFILSWLLMAILILSAFRKNDLVFPLSSLGNGKRIEHGWYINQKLLPFFQAADFHNYCGIFQRHCKLLQWWS